MGDIILTTPLIRAVRKKYPMARIDFVVKDQFAALVQGNPHLNKIYMFSKQEDNLKVIKEGIITEKYDWIIDIHKNFRSLYLRSGSGASNITDYPKYLFKRTLLVALGWNFYKEVEPVYKRYFKAVRPFGIEDDGMGAEIFVDPALEQQIRAKLVDDGYDFSVPLVVVSPGASFINKRWLPEKFASLVDKYQQDRRAFVVMTGGGEDRNLCEEINEMATTKALNYAGEFDLLGSAALLKQSDLVITNDTGIMHMAQSQKVPVTAIFGPTTRELGYFPFPDKSAVVERQLSCRPCTHNGLDRCPKGHFKCMREISVEEVFETSRKLLNFEAASSN